MKFAKLRHRVVRAETLVEGRRQQTIDNAGALLSHWKRSWTPWRIVLVGLGVGYLTGSSHPSRVMGATKWLRVVSMVSGMFTTLQASMAAWQADQAADKADEAADSAQDAAQATQNTQAAAGVAAAQAARHAASTGASPARDVPPRAAPGPGYAPPVDEHGETERWTAHPPQPAEAATHLSER